MSKVAELRVRKATKPVCVGEYVELEFLFEWRYAKVLSIDLENRSLLLKVDGAHDPVIRRFEQVYAL